MIFEWDAPKAESNARKHGVTFEMALTAFDDPFALITLDEKHSSREKRKRLLGESDSGVLMVVFTVRNPGSRYRIISARKANRRERKGYEEIKRLSI
jgi:uncharacterized DUF497 family protein